MKWNGMKFGMKWNEMEWNEMELLLYIPSNIYNSINILVLLTKKGI
jgi:hypothetical protein